MSLSCGKHFETEIYLINKYYTFLCSCQLLSFPIGYRHLAPIQGLRYFCHTSNPMRYINTLISAKLFSLVSAASSTPPLKDLPSPLPLLLLDVPFPDIEAIPVSPCLCPPRGLKTHSLVNCTSKIVLATQTSDFHSQVYSRCASK